MNPKQLTRSATDRKIAGICGGLGEYLNIDPVIFRIAFILTLFIGGTGLLVYLIMIFVVPEKPVNFQDYEKKNEIITDPFSEITKKRIKDAPLIIIGSVLILFGILFFFYKASPFRFCEFLSPILLVKFFFPMLFITGGIILVLFSKKL